MRRWTALVLMLAVGTVTAAAGEFSGFIEAEGSYFFHEPLFSDQEWNSASVAAQPEYYHEWQNGSSFTFVPFARVDSADSQRTHFDLRELNYLWLGDTWELRVGVGKVFWGTTEFVHLVDIINQTNLVESIDGEDKLGQPMVHLSIPRSWGVVDLFVLPYFRARTFPGANGRLRFGIPVDTDDARYESPDEQRHVDFALRYSHTIGTWDLGISHFSGTGREPALIPELNDSNEPILIPFYQQINQTGLELQLLAGEWLFKLEALYRTGQGPGFFATVSGFEYTLVGVAGTGLDLGVIGEFAYDDRGDAATTPYENDAMLGLRLGFNDAAGSELLTGLIHDIKTSARIVRVEANRRFGSRWRGSLEAWAFLDFSPEDRFSGFRDDDFVRLRLAYFF